MNARSPSPPCLLASFRERSVNETSPRNFDPAPPLSCSNDSHSQPLLCPAPQGPLLEDAKCFNYVAGPLHPACLLSSKGNFNSLNILERMPHSKDFKTGNRV